jgi:transcriptional regulator with XRE-family HTH domain
MAPSGTEDPEQIIRDVGRMIQQSRRAAGLTQAQMAERLGIAVRSLAHIEAGKQNLTLRTMTEIAAVLGVRTVDLLAPPESRIVKRGRPKKPV